MRAEGGEGLGVGAGEGLELGCGVGEGVVRGCGGVGGDGPAAFEAFHFFAATEE